MRWIYMELIGLRLPIILMTILTIFYVSNAKAVLVEVSSSENGRTTWFDTDTKRYSDTWDMAKRDAYMRRQPGYGYFRSSTGAVSNVAVRSTVTQTVAKRTVMQNLLANARRGGRFLGRGGLGGIAAGYVLEAAYDLVKEKRLQMGRQRRRLCQSAGIHRRMPFYWRFCQIWRGRVA
mgnify:CR=1 FL=1